MAPRRRRPTETEGTMQSVARILTANPEALRAEERAAGTPSIGPGNEREHECPHCRNSGWRRGGLPGSTGVRQCECAAEKARASNMSACILPSSAVWTTCAELLRFDDEVQPATWRSRSLAPFPRAILFDRLECHSNPSNRCQGMSSPDKNQGAGRRTGKDRKRGP
jgi:hypothetical protein